MLKRDKQTLTERLTVILTKADASIGVAKSQSGAMQDRSLAIAREALAEAFDVIVAIQQNARAI